MMKHFYIIIYTQNKELSYINFMCHLLKKDMPFFTFFYKNIQRKHVEYVAIFLFQFEKHFTEQRAVVKA